MSKTFWVAETFRLVKTFWVAKTFRVLETVWVAESFRLVETFWVAETFLTAAVAAEISPERSLTCSGSNVFCGFDISRIV